MVGRSGVNDCMDRCSIYLEQGKYVDETLGRDSIDATVVSVGATVGRKKMGDCTTPLGLQDNKPGVEVLRERRESAGIASKQRSRTNLEGRSGEGAGKKRVCQDI